MEKMDMLITILRGVLTLLYNPLLYLLIAAVFLVGWQRVRRERRSFGIKVYGILNTVLALIGPSLLLGAIGSVVLIGLGVALPAGLVVLVTVWTLLFMLTGQLRCVSPMLSFGAAAVFAAFMPSVHTGIAVIDRWAAEIRDASLFDFGIAFAVAALMEAAAVLLWGDRQTSPRLINSKRGKKVGAHEANRLWIAPIFFLIPATGAIHEAGWWPLSDGTVFGLCALPVAIGYQQFITHSLPKKAVQRSGLWLLATAIVITAWTAVGYFFRPDLCVAAAGAVALLSRLALIVWHAHEQNSKPLYFVDRGDGLRVVGIIPNTPAEKMGIQPGEIVQKVNGKPVRSEADFYYALQENATYCRLEVVDAADEVRFVKGTIFENDPHKIGLLFLEPSRRVKEKAN